MLGKGLSCFLCGKNQNTVPLGAAMNGKWGFEGKALMMLFPLKDTPLLAAGFFINSMGRKLLKGLSDLLADQGHSHLRSDVGIV